MLRVRGCKSSISTKNHLFSGHTLTTDLTQTSLLSLSNRSSAVLFVSVNHAYLCIQNRSWKETINTILLGCHYLSYFIGHFYFNIIHLFVGGSYISHSVFSWGDSTQIFSGTSTTVNTTCFWAHPGSHPCAVADDVLKSKHGKTDFLSVSSIARSSHIRLQQTPQADWRHR